MHQRYRRTNFLDQDSDNDGFTDAREAGPDPNNPLDSNNDGIADFLDENVPEPTDLEEDDQPDQQYFLPWIGDENGAGPVSAAGDAQTGNEQLYLPFTGN